MANRKVAVVRLLPVSKFCFRRGDGESRFDLKPNADLKGHRTSEKVEMALKSRLFGQIFSRGPKKRLSGLTMLKVAEILPTSNSLS